MAVNRDERLEQKVQKVRAADNRTTSPAPRVGVGVFNLWSDPEGKQYLITGAKDGGVYGIELERLR